MIKYYIIFIISFLSIFQVLANEYELIDKIVVIVEKDVITQKEIENEFKKKNKNLKFESIPAKEKEKIKKDIINYLLEKKLLIQYAITRKITPTSKDINIVITNILEKNNIEINQLKKQLDEEGTSFKKFQEDLKLSLIIQRIKDQEIMPYINISDYEVDAWLKNTDKNSDSEYKLTHILIKEKNPDKELIIEKIKNLNNKDDFSILAKNYSDGPNSENYGDLGWKKIIDLPEIFVNFISKAKIGEISGPLISPNGIHFLKIESIKNLSNEAKVFTKNYKFQQILLKHTEITDDLEQEIKLKNIKNLISDGLNFAEAVKKYSDEQFNLNANKLEWININNLLPEFKKKTCGISFK